jgi:hypothetical protein
MTTRRPLLLALLAVALAAVLVRQRGGLGPPSPPPEPPTPTPTPAFQSPWTTEQEWLVDQIVRDIAETALYMQTRTLPEAQARELEVKATVGPGDAPDTVSVEIPVIDVPLAGPRRFSGRLRLHEHVFDPRVYSGMARELAYGPDYNAGVCLPSLPRKSSEDRRVLEALTDLRAETLFREDKALSHRLETAPDAEAHEQAALLLGAFALRDHAGASTDTRVSLARMAAHLAMARGLTCGEVLGLTGQLAEALLATLVGRERDALDRLDALERSAATRAERAWVRALRLRNTGDWRLARDAKGLSLLEEQEEFRALVMGLDDASASTWLDHRSPSPVPDWGTIALESRALSVETGNRFAVLAPVLQMSEVQAVRTAMGRMPADHAALMAALNERPTRHVTRSSAGAPRVSVLGWGLWADRTQRHLVFELMRLQAYYRYTLGNPGEAAAAVEQSRREFGRLEMYPLVLRAHATNEREYRDAVAAFRELARRSPERLTGGHWELVRQKEDFAPVPRDLPDENLWFRPALPAGTLVDVRWRLSVLAALRGASTDDIGRLRALAPYDRDLADSAAARMPGTHSAAELAAAYGALADYDLFVMGKLADAAYYDADEFRTRQGAMCRLVAERCFFLGYRLAEMGFPDEAATAYQRAFDGAEDRVGAANQSLWLVDYYVDHGQAPKAEKVARAAASTYAERGLYVMARFLEKTGRLREAEEYYRRILDRYERPTRLAGFYYRQARVRGKTEYEARLRDALALAMPDGLESFDQSTLPARPEDGVVVKKENDLTKKFGLKYGNVIVGLDGFRVRDWRQYEAVRDLDLSPKMKIVAWRGASYDDVAAEIWDRQFRVDMEDLKPRVSPPMSR